jgi:molecular chaperone DnaK
MENLAPMIGIDLGTTYSAVSVVHEGMPRILSDGNERLIPSVVGFSGKGRWLVGAPARNQYVFAPENTVRSIKRKMGTGEKVLLGGYELTPQQISAFVLREMKRIAEEALGQAVEKAVITVPAYFSDAQRQATKDAGEIAGLEVVRIINEPTAAALAYGLDRAEDQMVLVYDLGGGTFDVSLVELTAGVVEVLASHGDTRLGGDDFDSRLVNHLVQLCIERFGVDLSNNRQAMARLTRAAEKAKIWLSDHPFAWIREEYLFEKDGQPRHLEYEISRESFEEMVADLLQQTTVSVDRVLADANLAPNDVDRILLVGGSTRIPAVWQLLAEHTGIEPEMAINPDEAVALGAGIQAAISAGVPINSILVDVTPFSLGVEVATFIGNKVVPGIYKPLIRRNSTVPRTKEEVFETIYPNQDAVEIRVYQGESPIANQNRLLGNFLISDLQPTTQGELAEVTVCFDIDVNGILRVQATDRKSGKQQAITVAASRERLSAEEIGRAVAQLAEMELEQSERPGIAEFNILIERAELLLAKARLDADQADRLQSLVDEIREAYQLEEGEYPDTLLEDLIDLLFELED